MILLWVQYQKLSYIKYCLVICIYLYVNNIHTNIAKLEKIRYNMYCTSIYLIYLQNIQKYKRYYLIA